MHTWIGGDYERLCYWNNGSFFYLIEIFLALENESSVDATRARAINRDDGCLRGFAR